MEALRKTLNKRLNPAIPTDLTVDLAEFVLKNNSFEFDGSQFFLQKRGTAIGTRMAPAYANLFMHNLESQLLNLAPVKPYLWLRYTDDIFMIWTAGEESLLEFLQWINELHDNIKFTWDWSKRTINYLDVQIIINNGVIETDLYTKPTDKHQYLFHTSCHPKGVKQSIPYAQALRLRRICSTSVAFENNNHKSRLRANSRMSAVDKESDDLLYRHFYSHGHHRLPDVSIQLTDKVNDKDDLLAKEGHWVYRIHSIKTDGLNESDFFFDHKRRERRRK